MLNQVQLIGNIGQKEIKITNGKEYVNFTIAVNDYYTNKAGEKVEKTNWFNVSSFNEHLVKIIKEHVKKGDKLFIQGSLENTTVEKNGEKRTFTNINLGFNSIIELLTPKTKSSPSGGDEGQGTAGSEPAPAYDADDKIPF